MVSILFIGDPHFQVSNIPEVNMFIEKITKLAEDKAPDLICIGGDILHTHERLHTTPLNKAYQLVDNMRRISKTYVLVGNHDYTNNQQYLTDNHWMNGMKDWKNVVIVDKVVTETINDNLFVFAPYVYPGRFIEALNTLEMADWKDARCIFAHQEFFGCKMGAIVSIEGDKWDLKYPNVVSGHIHSRQSPQKNVYYPGSSMQHAFGESTKNIIAYLNFREIDREYELEEVNLNLPRKRIVYMDMDNIEDYKVPETKDKIKVTITGVYDEFKAFKKTQKYKKLIKDGAKVVFKVKNMDVLEEKVDGKKLEFSSILHSIVNSSKNDYLFQAYELVMNKI